MFDYMEKNLFWGPIFDIEHFFPISSSVAIAAQSERMQKKQNKNKDVISWTTQQEVVAGFHSSLSG